MTRLVVIDISFAGNFHRHLTYPVSFKYQRYYNTTLLAASNDGIVITDQYLRNFVHTALYHLLQIPESYHSDSERHKFLLASFHELVF